MQATTTGVAAAGPRGALPPVTDPSTLPWEPAERGSAVVCIPVFGALDMFAQCLRSVLDTTPPEVHVLVADDASPDPAARRLVDEANRARPDRPEVGYLRQPENVGFVRNVNHALRLLAPADVIVLNSDCVVSHGWYEGMRRAAYSDTRVATVSTLTNHGTIVSVPERNQPLRALPQEWSIDQAAAAIRVESPVLHPTLPSAIGHCLYLRRSAIDLVGDFDEAFSPGYEEEVDFSQRCTRHGLSHVLADDVFVLHYGGGSFDARGTAAQLREDHHRTIQSRYPYWDSWVAEVQVARDTPLARSLSAGRRALRGQELTIDGRILTEFMTGSQLHALEVIAAVHDSQSIAIRVIVPPTMGDYAADALSGLERVRLVTESQAWAEPATDVVHCPYHVRSFEDLRLLLAVGQRLVITHQDLIAFHNPAYHDDYASWQEHRALTRIVLATADRVAFFSHHARAEAVREELVDPARAKVVFLGTDHRITSLQPEPSAPRGAEGLDERPFLLCLGTDFLHKNRVFAMRLFAALREQHGYEGRLVLAGPQVAAGSSAGEEAEALSRSPELAEHVVDLAAVDEAEKRWLLERTDAVIYPTTYEGFGLVPFEAGEVGVPCFFASETALAELLPPAAATLVPWDAAASADNCAELLADPQLRRRHVDTLRAAGAALTWRRTATELLAMYDETVAAPARETRGLLAEMFTRAPERLRRSRDTDYEEVYSRALAGPDGVLPRDMTRPLLVVSQSRPLRALFFAPMRAMYRLGRLLAPGRRDGAR